MSLCSAEEDQDGTSLDVEDHDDLHSPTDVSEDSVEVRVTPITAKRKHSQVLLQHQPKAQQQQRAATALPPSPKRRRPASPLSPFRPWSAPSPSPTRAPATVPAATAATTTRLPTPAPQEEPLALVKTRVSTATPTVPVIPRSPRGGGRSAAATPCRTVKPAASRFSVESIIGDVAATPVRVPSPSPAVVLPSVYPTSTCRSASPRGRARSAASIASKDGDHVDHGGGPGCSSGPRGAGSGSGAASGAGVGAGQQRNYKNMTRERRIEANARERTRVHTISAAFDTLRRTVPAYSHSQKLSKLSVLRIACSYILTLSRVAGMDYSADQSEPPVQECVDLVTKTIQTEGKLRRKRDD